MKKRHCRQWKAMCLSPSTVEVFFLLSACPQNLVAFGLPTAGTFRTVRTFTQRNLSQDSRKQARYLKKLFALNAAMSTQLKSLVYLPFL